MINLLPHDDKREIRAARTNVLLFRYTIASFVALLILLLVAGAIVLLLNDAKQRAEQTTKENQAAVAGYAEVQSKATAFRSDLTKAKQLFDSEIRYHLVVREVARLLPSGTEINDFRISEASFTEPLTLQVKVTNGDRAAALLRSFQQSAIFTNPAYGSLTSNTGDDAETYPYNLELIVTLNKEAIKR